MLAAMMIASGCASSGASRRDAGPRQESEPRPDGAPPAGDWTVIVIPDTQNLAAMYPEIFEAQTQFIVEERDALNIQFVLHVGDITEDNGGAQWDVAYRALSRLDGVVPYVLTPGNHDLGPGGSAADRSTKLNTYFPLSRFEREPSYGGAFEANRTENTYHVFDTPGGPWLVLALEFGPRDAVVEWASEVVRAHPDLRTFVVTHAYLYSDDTRYDRARFGADQRWSPHSYGIATDPAGVNDAEEMFRAFIEGNDQIDFVVSGHVLNDGVGRLTSPQLGGGTVHQLLSNYQHMPQGGAGFLRIMTFSADGRRVEVRTYSPYLDVYKEDADNHFWLELEAR